MLTLVYVDEDVVAMACAACDTLAPFAEQLPFVNQTASFLVDHGCLLWQEAAVEQGAYGVR